MVAPRKVFMDSRVPLRPLKGVGSSIDLVEPILTIPWPFSLCPTAIDRHHGQRQLK